jgi:hypothetical protein
MVEEVGAQGLLGALSALSEEPRGRKAVEKVGWGKGIGITGVSRERGQGPAVDDGCQFMEQHHQSTPGHTLTVKGDTESSLD